MKKNLFVLFVAVMLVMAGCGSKPTLAQWVNSEEVADNEEAISEGFADAGLGFHAKFSADGEDILVFSCIYEQYQMLAGLNQSEIDAVFSEKLDSLGLRLTRIFDACEKATGITLKCIRVRFVNADGTVIYSQDYVDTK